MNYEEKKRKAVEQLDSIPASENFRYAFEQYFSERAYSFKEAKVFIGDYGIDPKLIMSTDVLRLFLYRHGIALEKHKGKFVIRYVDYNFIQKLFNEAVKRNALRDE